MLTVSLIKKEKRCKERYKKRKRSKEMNTDKEFNQKPEKKKKTKRHNSNIRKIIMNVFFLFFMRYNEGCLKYIKEFIFCNKLFFLKLK